MTKWEPIDITGQKFNMLTAIRYDHTANNGTVYWLFKCDCGQEKAIIKTHVVTGKKKNCGCVQCNRSDNITGQKFNMLTAVRYDHSKSGTYWLFRCDCGTERILRKTNVVNGYIKSCGCSKGKCSKENKHTAHEDITGQKFGKLTAIKQDHGDYWLFKCDCGSEKVINKTNVIRGFTKSCGCIQENDITGQKFGKLTAIKKDHGKYWLFKCDCGQEKIINKSTVVSGKTQSCGCIKRTDITGQKFNMLTAIRCDHNNSKGVSYWLFRCDCGSEKVLNRQAVMNGNTKSCGCIQSTMETSIRKLLTENQIPYEEQKSFKECRDKLALRFDFYIPDLNMLIEAQGVQHYKSIKYFGGQEKLNRQQRKDQIKKDYCSANNINLLEIKYDDDLESIIDKEVVQPWNILIRR